MPNKPLWALATIAVVLSLPFRGHASSPAFWQVSTQAEFLEGEAENLSIDNDGRLLLGVATELIHETNAPFLWSVVALPDGSLLAGTGNEGKVLRVEPGGQADTLFDADELEVHALARAGDDRVYVATSPDGRVYKVGLDGSAETFFDPEDKYIWALAVDSDGNLFAGTGEHGLVYKIAPDGTGAPFYDTKATHVTALAFDADGNLLAGSDSPGRVFRIDATGKAFVLLDTAFNEIHALRVAPDGAIYAAAVSGKPGGAGASTRPDTEPTRAPIATISTEITSIAIGEVPAVSTSTATPAREAPRPRGAVYRILPDGLWDTVWESGEDAPYDLAFDAQGELIIGTGNSGKIFRTAGDPSTTTLLTRADAQQVTMFVRELDETYLATANPGKIFKLSADRSTEGSYESVVNDAGTVATWGSIRWRGNRPPGSEVTLYTRSGNTATADDTWSDWTPVGSEGEGQQIRSPKSRYLQWRAVLSAEQASPVLTSVTVAYLERNLRPTVASITVHPPGTVFQKPFSSGQPEIAGYDQVPSDAAGTDAVSGTAAAAATRPTVGRAFYRKGLQTFVWEASDDNDDALQFDVLYRSEGETRWTPLRRGLADPILAWDTSSVPDGSYVIKILASDAQSNSPGNALTSELESAAFDIDNSPPIVAISSVDREDARVLIGFTVRDAHSPVRRVEYSTDANTWRVIYPTDGIPDSQVEEFEIVLEGEAAAGRAIIRATDAMSNAVTAVGGADPSRSR